MTGVMTQWMKERLARQRAEARLEGREEGRLEGEQIGIEKGQQIGEEKGLRKANAWARRQGLAPPFPDVEEGPSEDR